jgi:precorrin-2 dehydrogenase / sirohydrochlorin ferrochelatase
MLPILLESSTLKVGVAGEGEALARRVKMLAEAGIGHPSLFASRAPAPEDIAALTILFVAGLDYTSSRALAETARAAGVLVNVEDMPDLCDFHMPAQVRRGDLVLTVSTGGRAPGLSRLLREDLQRRYGPEWRDRLDEIATLRRQWRSEGAGPGEVAERTRRFVSGKGWLA